MGLDRAKATPVYGSSRAAFYQNGRYYTRDGAEISHEEAAQPDPDFPPSPPDPIVEETVPRYFNAGEEPQEAPPADPQDASRRHRLRKMSADRIAELVKLAGGTPETGHGSKNKNMEWLLEHTE